YAADTPGGPDESGPENPWRPITVGGPPRRPDQGIGQPGAPGHPERRSFLVTSSVAVAAGAVSLIAGRVLTERYVTPTCVSNPVAGPYVGNARWLGASLASLLRSARVQAGADQLLCTSTDGFTSGTPIQAILDGRDALLAVAMNGAPLPVAHGFPVRMVTPGLYGYVSATKWVTDVKVTTFGAET